MLAATIDIDRLLGPLVDCLPVDVAAKVANATVDEATQGRIDYLADRCNEGQLTDEERDEYAGYLHAIRVISVLQAKARSIVRLQS